MAVNPPTVVVDCDPGIDDALAILVAARHTELAGLTTVNGNAAVDHTTANALLVAATAGLDVPVHAGAARPLLASPNHAPHVHGIDGLGGAARRELGRAPAGADAAGYLIDESRRRSLHLVALGPLTNVAMAVLRDEGFAGRLAGLTVMGGAIEGGNATAVAEFNIWADPEAAAIVMRCGAPIRLVPLDVTHQVCAGAAEVARLREAGTAVGDFAADLLAHYAGDGASGPGSDAAEPVVGAGALHDPCAVIALTHPGLFEWTECHVGVELAGQLTRGMTVVDRRPRAPAANVALATGVDAGAVLASAIGAARG